MITAELLFEKLKHVRVGAESCIFTQERCEKLTPLINEIHALKAKKNAVILAHSYVSPEIVYGVADYTGDSFELSKRARESSADTIVFSAVKFMADTAKLLSPDKTVLVPSKFNGCTLADSITGAQVRALRAQYPDHAFVCYINTTAEVKAECDICVTSSNVYDIITKYPSDKIYFLPDRLMGQNIKNELQFRGVNKEILFSDGRCYVHEAYDPEMIEYLRFEHPGVRVLSHPECSSGVVEFSDFVGSTSQMMQYVKNQEAPSFFMLTECGLTHRLQVEVPEKKFIGSCTMCKYMKSNTLSDILRVLKQPDAQDIIEIPTDVADRARRCIDQMFRYA